jgi:hypothetical protein
MKSIERYIGMSKNRNYEIKQKLQGRYTIYKIKGVTVGNSGPNI